MVVYGASRECRHHSDTVNFLNGLQSERAKEILQPGVHEFSFSFLIPPEACFELLLFAHTVSTFRQQLMYSTAVMLSTVLQQKLIFLGGLTKRKPYHSR